ncbi:ceramidase domain-containing protein [Tabrizicola sp. J26]|uniref:ceramidase domain-containing protein n=1 Tax=Alitabrizicola rongguiensis TaxID=2909234 RepID=UPI001F192533|nr:ceramidase domain-containing protein [Tabrizicola rongguiensis]MCF1708412.1 ceramidase domain-containing protein [Tabrizicola rongguiensis]
MDWTAAVDIYCERIGPGFWAEPVNALTNLAFPLAAAWAAATALQRSIRDPIVWALIILAGLIGIGSFLFHSYATRWSELVDTVPIWGFVGLFIVAALRFLSGISAPGIMLAGAGVMAGAGLVAFLATGEGPSGTDWANGSYQYAPALLALLVFAAIAYRRRHPSAPWITLAVLVFAASLGFRTLDRDICASFPQGTHFLWHLLNALVVGLLLQMLIRTGGFASHADR